MSSEWRKIKISKVFSWAPGHPVIWSGPRPGRMERPRPVLLGRDPSSRWCPRWDSNQILMILILLWLHLQFQKSGNHVETLEG